MVVFVQSVYVIVFVPLIYNDCTRTTSLHDRTRTISPNVSAVVVLAATVLVHNVHMHDLFHVRLQVLHTDFVHAVRSQVQ